MATPNIDTAIRSRIDSFLSELSDLVRQAALESVHAALGGGAAPRLRAGRPRGAAKRGPGRPRKTFARAKPAKRGKRVKRTSEQVEAMAARVLAHVKQNAGHRLEQIGKGLRIATKELKLPVAKLLAARKLKTQGQKRGTKYFAGGAGRKSSKSRRGPKARTRRSQMRRKAKRAGRRAKRVGRRAKPAGKLSRKNKRAMRRAAKPSAPQVEPAAAA